jgi:hypothetical protein
MYRTESGTVEMGEIIKICPVTFRAKLQRTKRASPESKVDRSSSKYSPVTFHAKFSRMKRARTNFIRMIKLNMICPILFTTCSRTKKWYIHQSKFE